MSLQFSESSPGVHMASWENPSKGGYRTVVIIESLGKFTLYVDGDVIDRDFETFDAAEARASVMLTAGRSRRMVQIAGVLVFLAVAGGTTVGIAKLLSGTSDIALATFAQSTNTATQPQQASAPKASPVKTVVLNAKASPVKTVRTTETAASPAPSRPGTYTPPPITVAGRAVIVTATGSTGAPTAAQAPSETTGTTTAPAAAAPAAAASRAPQPGPRVFSASRPVFGGKQFLAEQRKQAAVPAKARPRFSDLKATGRTKVGGLIYVPNTYAQSPAGSKSPAGTQSPTGANSPVATPPRPATAEIAAVPLPERKPRTGVAALQTARIATTDGGQAGSAAQSTALGEELPDEREAVATGTGVAPVETAPAYTRPVTRPPKASVAKKRRASKRRSKVHHARKKKTVKSRRRRARRVMRCVYGGCRWVAAGGYYDRQYRRHRRYR